MNDQPARDANWEPTPSGQLDQLARDIRLRRRNMLSLRIAGSTLVVFAAVLALQQTVSRANSISCDTTQARVESYFNDSLTNRTKLRIEQHLAKCPHCREFYDERQDRDLMAWAETAELFIGH